MCQWQSFGLEKGRVGGHIRGMMYPSTMIKFQPLPLKVGMEWHVVVTYPSGHKEHIAGFKHQTEAVNWIGSPPCMQWVKERGYQ